MSRKVEEQQAGDSLQGAIEVKVVNTGNVKNHNLPSRLKYSLSCTSASASDVQAKHPSLVPPVRWSCPLGGHTTQPFSPERSDRSP